MQDRPQQVAACAEPYPATARPFRFHHSDELCAPLLIAQLRGHVSAKSVIVIDHLQLLDQRRSSPALQEQLETLTAFARDTGCIFVFLSRLHHSFDSQRRPPNISDVRLPNALDLSVFDQLLFLHHGQEQRHPGT